LKASELIKTDVAIEHESDSDSQCEFGSDVEIISDWLLGKSKTTQQTYFSIVKGCLEFLGEIQSWSKRGILVWLEGQKGKQKISTINKKLAAVRSLLDHCVREGYLPRNVAANIDPVKLDKENKELQAKTVQERIIGQSEVWALINAAANNKRDYLALKLCYQLGLRVHELVNLHWSDITREGTRYKVKIVGKNSKVAFLPLDPTTYNELLELGTDGYLFVSQKGSKLSRSQFHRIVKRYAQRAGLNPNISAHWLRHQRASDLANSGQFTISQVQKFMRHSNVQTTSGYIHVVDEIGSDALL
jgi:integrase/recombinase XerD